MVGVDATEHLTADDEPHGERSGRRTRRRIGAAVGAIVVVGVAIAAVLIVGGDEPDTLVTTDDTQVPVTTVADDGAEDDVESPEPTVVAAPPVAGQPVEVVEGAARVASPAGTNGAPEYGEWMVPWEDGFLVGSTSFAPQPLPDELPEEVVALFPQEVIDLFGGELPDTISEATAQLSDAGLLDVVAQIIADNPAASDAIYGAPIETPPTLDVRFTTDGETWEPREMVAPPGATYFSSATVVGDRLAVVYSTVDPVTGMPVDSRVVVATTSDLTTWATQDIVLPAPPDLPDLPDGVTWSVYPQGLVANDTGWVVPVYSSLDIDPYSLVPDDVRLGLDESNGLSIGTDRDGIIVESDFDDSGNPTQSQRFTWEELGVDPAIAELVSRAGVRPHAVGCVVGRRALADRCATGAGPDGGHAVRLRRVDRSDVVLARRCHLDGESASGRGGHGLWCVRSRRWADRAVVDERRWPSRAPGRRTWW